VSSQANKGGAAKEGRISFLKKRNKKLLVFLVDAAARTRVSKSFLVLFFKKELLSFTPPPQSPGADCPGSLPMP
jgi:hypothetical protein